MSDLSSEALAKVEANTGGGQKRCGFCLSKGIFLVAIMLAGCSASDDLVQLELGNKWTYNVRTGFRTYVESVEVRDHVSVAGEAGYELSGPMGRSTLAWSRGRLVASELGNTQFQPALPLLQMEPEGLQGKIISQAENYMYGEPEFGWKGTAIAFGTTYSGTGRLTQSRERLEIGGRKFDTVLSQLDLDLEGKKIELKSWFSPGFGLVRQEQRTDDKLDAAIELLSGP